MTILVAGLGSIGRRHLANLKIIDPALHTIVWRHGAGTAYESEPLPDGRVVYSLEEALDAKPDAALVTSPASSHIETSLALASRDIHLFIEKPLSHTLDGVDDLLDLCRRRGLTVMVGYNFRFYRPLQILRQALHDGLIGRPVSFRAEAGQYLPDWRPGRDYRRTVSACRALGGGVVLELSHELDYVRWLLGEVESVSAMTGRLSDLDVDVEDTAELTLRLASGAVGSVHLNMVQRAPTRSCRIIGTEGSLLWDGMTHRVQLFSAKSDEWADLHPAVPLDRNDMYVAELRHFLKCVQGCAAPTPSGADGARVLQIALAALRASDEQRTITP